MRIATILVWFVQSTTVMAANGAVSMVAHVEQLKVKLGEPLRIVVTLENDTDGTELFVVRDANFIVEVTGVRGTTLIEGPRYTSKALPFVDDEVPLRPGAAYRAPLSISLNDLNATFGEGWIDKPGRYSFRVLYDSERSQRPHRGWAWKGSLRSNTVAIEIDEPSSAQIAASRDALKECVRRVESDCDSNRLANFYRVVTDDDAAADLLMALIAKTPLEIWLLDAIVAQGRTSDADRVRGIAAAIPDEKLQQVYANAAAKLESGDAPRTRRDHHPKN